MLESVKVEEWNIRRNMSSQSLRETKKPRVHLPMVLTLSFLHLLQVNYIGYIYHSLVIFSIAMHIITMSFNLLLFASYSYFGSLSYFCLSLCLAVTKHDLLS